MRMKFKQYMKRMSGVLLGLTFLSAMTAYAGQEKAETAYNRSPVMVYETSPMSPNSTKPVQPGTSQIVAPQVALPQLSQTQTGVNVPYLGGAELTMLAPATSSQNMSYLLQTQYGSIIVIDGGLREDADHLIETIQAKGGRVAAWLITHPHSDHIGALTEILNREPIPVQIDNIYYSFLERDTYAHGEHMGRMGDYDNLVAAFGKVAPEKLHGSLSKGQKIQVDDVTINVLNLPYRSLSNTFNNSSIAYRLDVGGKRILFLGDMGWDAGQNLLERAGSGELKADVVQMAHHGQDGVEEGIYRIINPEICLWPTPGWLWDNVKNGQAGAGPWKTLTVRSWMNNLGVNRNICVKDGDQVLK